MEKFRATLPYIAILVIVIVIRSFIVSPVIVVGPSMNNTLKNGNVLLLNKMYYEFNEIKRFDVVVIKTTSHPIIKRVIALPNEEVYLEKGNVYINGILLDQKFSYIKDTDDYTILDEGYNRIPSGYYFVLGDNRAESADSRSFGLVKGEYIEGKINYSIFPFKKIK